MKMLEIYGETYHSDIYMIIGRKGNEADFSPVMLVPLVVPRLYTSQHTPPTGRLCRLVPVFP